MVGYSEVPIPQEILNAQRQGYLDQAREVEDTFKAALEEAGLKGSWQCVEGAMARSITERGRYMDLVVLGPPGEDSATRVTKGDVGRVIIDSGRAVLYIPKGDVPDAIGNFVIIGWDAGREAVRAVGDALPILERATRAQIVIVDSGASEASGGVDLPAERICAHLERHGVNAEPAMVHAQGGGVGELLVSRAQEQACDLIVMGGYGHTRLREYILGGATDYVLTHTNTPTLFAH
jgi:nucleotide-binding universal stress UspA family protein